LAVNVSIGVVGYIALRRKDGSPEARLVGAGDGTTEFLE
jgi:hypothetical protein